MNRFVLLAGLMVLKVGSLMAAPAKPAAQVPQAQAVIAGHVVAPDGQPVSGAQISWVVVSYSGEIQSRTLAQVASGEDGGFRFENAAQLIAQANAAEARIGRAYLLTKADGFALAFAPIETNATITLRSAAKIERRFVDENGAPISDLEVRPNVLVGRNGLLNWYPLPSSIAQLLAVRTDEDGRAIINGLAPEFEVRLQIDDARWAALSYRENTVQPGEASQIVKLQRGAVVSGKVRYPDGKPVKGVRVGAQSSGTGGAGGSGVTDAQGAYRLERMRPGPYNVALDLGDAKLAQDWTARARAGITLSAGQTLSEQNFTLGKGALIEGHVLSEDGKTPVVGQSVGVYGPAHPKSSAWVQIAATDQKGFFQLRVPGGAQYVYLQSEPVGGFARPTTAPVSNVSLKRGSGSYAAYEFSIANGRMARLEWRLPRGPKARAIWVLAVDEANQPVAGVEVYSSSSAFGGDTFPLGKTDAGGRLQLKGQSKSQTLRARKGAAATAVPVIALPGDRAVLRLKARGLASVRGRVINAQGEPQVGASVELVKWTYDSGIGGHATSTDAEGRFVLDDLWTDYSYTVSATAPGFGQSDSERLKLKPGEARDLGEVKMPRADSFVAGRVVDEAGEPVAGASLNLQGIGTPFKETTSDAQGHFRFEDVVSGDPALSLGAGVGGNFERSAHKENVKSGRDDIVLILRSEKAERAAAASQSSGPRETVDALRGKVAPPLRAVSWLNSAPLNAAQWRGRVVIVDFWGIGCGPCVAALPGVQRAWQMLKGKGLLIVGLHDAGATPQELQSFARKNGLTYPLAIDADIKEDGWFGATFREWGVVGIPAVAVIGRDGRIAYVGHSFDEAVQTATAALAVAG